GGIRPDGVVMRAVAGMEPAVQRDSPRALRREDVTDDPLATEPRQVEVEDQVVLGVFDPAEDAVLLEHRDAADELGIEPVAEARGRAVGELRDQVVEELPQRPGDQARGTVEVPPLDLIDPDAEPRRGVASRLDVDARADIEAELPPPFGRLRIA